MRIHSMFGSILVAVVATTAANAQKHAESILPGADGTVCEFIAKNIGSHTGAPQAYGRDAPKHAFADLLVKRAAADVDGDGDVELLDYTVYPAGESPITYGFDDNYEWRDTAPEGIDRDDDLRWWESGRYLFFRDTWHLVYFNDRGLNLASYVIAYGKRQSTFACKFTARYNEIASGSSSPAVDAAYAALIARPWIAEGKGTQLSQTDRAYLSTLPGGFRHSGESLYGDGVSWSINVRINSALQTVDMDGDGIKERFARMTLSSGATPPCAAVYFELLPSEGATEPDPAKRDLWRKLQSVSYSTTDKYAATCGLEHDLVEIDGVGYFYTARYDNAVVERQLSKLEGRTNSLTLVKRSQFQAEHRIDYDAAKQK